MIPFKPVIEAKVEGAFLTEHPADIIKAGKAAAVPWVTGINTEDGALRAAGENNILTLIIIPIFCWALFFYRNLRQSSFGG